MTDSRVGSGLIAVNLAVMLFGLAGVLGKLSGLASPLIVLARVAFGGLTIATLVYLRRSPVRPKNRRDLTILLGQGALLALHWTAFFQAINVSSVAIGLLSFSSFPLFAAMIEPVILHTRPHWVQLVATVAVLPGIYLLVPSFSLDNAVTRGVLWGLLAGATFALLSVTNRWLSRSYSSLVINLYQDLAAAVVLLPAFWLVPTSHLFEPSTLLILIILGVCCTALAHTLFVESLRSITAQLASLIATLEPVWGIAFALLLLGEIPTPRMLIGGALILTATITGIMPFSLFRRRAGP
jgi:drug/metabolite transporter (DMT)-like permease